MVGRDNCTQLHKCLLVKTGRLWPLGFGLGLIERLLAMVEAGLFGLLIAVIPHRNVGACLYKGLYNGKIEASTDADNCASLATTFTDGCSLKDKHCWDEGQAVMQSVTYCKLFFWL